MNKILTIILAMTAMCVVVSCSDDEDGYSGAEPVSITSNTASILPAIASSATIVVDASSAISVTTSVSWCTTSIDGNVITVAVTENPSIESRCAIVTIKDGDRKCDVSVLQRGQVFDLSAPSDNDIFVGAELVYPMTHTGTVTATSEESWISAIVEDEALRVTIEDNTSGTDREGTLVVKAGNITEELHFYQYDAGNVFGAYTLSGKNAGGTAAVSYDGTLSISEDGKSLVFATTVSGTNYELPLAFESTGDVTFAAGTACGMVGRYYLYTAVGSATANNGRGAQFKTRGSLSGKLHKPEGGVMECVLTDNGSVEGYTIDLIRLNRYTVENITESSSATNIFTVRDPVLRKK